MMTHSRTMMTHSQIVQLPFVIPIELSIDVSNESHSHHWCWYVSEINLKYQIAVTLSKQTPGLELFRKSSTGPSGQPKSTVCSLWSIGNSGVGVSCTSLAFTLVATPTRRLGVSLLPNWPFAMHHSTSFGYCRYRPFIHWYPSSTVLIWLNESGMWLSPNS
jgi:hypothetical protein